MKLVLIQYMAQPGWIIPIDEINVWFMLKINKFIDKRCLDWIVHFIILSQ